MISSMLRCSRTILKIPVKSLPSIHCIYRSIFIDTESTPNPNSLKFLPGKVVLQSENGTGMFFQKGEFRELQRSPLAKSLFTIDGVKGVFLGSDFITITKNKEESWQVLKPLVFSQILDFYADENAVAYIPEDASNPLVSDTAILEDDSKIVATIKELLESRIRPAVQEDGGDIFYAGFDEETGIVKVRLAGSCVGCPSSSVTLRNGVENMLMHYIAEVKGIQEVTEGDECSQGQEEVKETKLKFVPDSIIG